MVTKTTTRPTPRSSQSHSTTQSHRSSSKMSATPLSPPPRIAASVGQPFPPHLRSPATHNDNVRTPSPNYFGLALDSAKNPQDSGAGPKGVWETTSSIISFEATTPKHVPLDSNPDFEAFRKQTNQAHAFNLGNLAQFSPTSSDQTRSRFDERPTRAETQEYPSPRSRPRIRDETPDRMDLDAMQEGRGINVEPRRRSEMSLNAPSFFDVPRRESPIPFDPQTSPVQRNMVSRLDDRHPRLSLPQNRADPPSPHIRLAQRGVHHRADTLPSSLEDGPDMITPAQLRDMLEGLPQEHFLLLDLRVFPQFSQSRIKGALNLCIPTTLLKRPSFNLQKLQDTFANAAEKERFAQWKGAKYLVVYDAYSTDKKDAPSSVNTLKKFSNEGYKGSAFILRGGFTEFSKNYPHLIDSHSSRENQSSKISLSLGTTGPGVAPVAGGCLMPATKNAANPFFSNIRQNQDLIGGVGQQEIKLPQDLAQAPPSVVPRWLHKAANKEDHGKMVADKFLHLELEEQTRMTKALSNGVTYGNNGTNSKDVQIAGVEKGSKNRYNNIWPFEHARVRLQGRPDGACDYVNASHIKASRSNKRYIASQGPLPATFEDFWSVIWDQDIRVIVMLTAESEGGQLKCHPYWSSNDYGPMRLKSLSEKKVSLEKGRHRPQAERQRSDSGRKRANTTAESAPPPPPAEPPHAVVRKFSLSHSAHPFSPMREITQIHYSSWPDFGAPASPSQLLGLVELCNLTSRSATAPAHPARSDEAESDENSRPILVHCSAGCGRTGTFCAIDSVIDMLKRQRKEAKSGIIPMDATPSKAPRSSSSSSPSNSEWMFDQDLDLIEKTVEDFRGQRLSMVQSLRQYVLCYETVLEWISQQHFGGSGLSRKGGKEGSPFGHERRSSDMGVVMKGKS